MLTLYFSGTGNTKYIAERFSEKMGFACYSIEENLEEIIDKLSQSSRICVCYPVYGSRVPRILKEFAKKHMNLFQDKEVIIIATQLIASGDGARAFADIFPKTKNYFKIIYAEHINMPNNVCNLVNFGLFRIKNGAENQNTLKKANIKLARICENIQNGRVIKRGFNFFSVALGLLQGVFEEKMNARGKNVRISGDCNQCGLCVKACPMKNLIFPDNSGGTIAHNGNCTICYRCVNLCPQKAITTFFHKKPTVQYHGVLLDKTYEK